MKKHKIVVTFTVKGKSRVDALEVLDRLLTQMDHSSADYQPEAYDQLKHYTMERRKS